jgi:hypothetical protein
MALVKYNNNSLSAITAASSLPTGAMTLIKEQVSTTSTTISFVNGGSDVVLDSTYPIYLFKFINCHPSGDGSVLMFNASDDTSSHSYDLTKTSNMFYARHDEDGTDGQITYSTSDLAQSTNFQELNAGTGGDNDQSVSGELWLFNPSSTTFVKHFMATTSNNYETDMALNYYTAGYINTTAAVTAIQFKMGDSQINGTFKLYGIKDS